MEETKQEYPNIEISEKRIAEVLDKLEKRIVSLKIKLTPIIRNSETLYTLESTYNTPHPKCEYEKFINNTEIRIRKIENALMQIEEKSAI